MILAAEFLSIPSSAVKIASERRCAILVHSDSHPAAKAAKGGRQKGTGKKVTKNIKKGDKIFQRKTKGGGKLRGGENIP